MNDKNLEKGVATQFKAGEEQAKIARAGGIASGKARRAKRDARELAIDLIRNGKVKIDKSTLANLKRMGATGSDNHTIEAISMVAIGQKMMRGDVNAFRLYLEIIGEDARTRNEEENRKLEREMLAGGGDEEAEESDGFIEAMNGVAMEVFADGTDTPQNPED